MLLLASWQTPNFSVKTSWAIKLDWYNSSTLNNFVQTTVLHSSKSTRTAAATITTTAGPEIDQKPGSRET